MRWLLPTLTSFVWALWLGGLITLFISVGALFKEGRDLGRAAAPVLFAAFEPYRLILAAAGLVVVFFWYLGNRSRLVMAVFALMSLAGATAAVSHVLVSRPMQDLRERKLSSTPQFASLHRYSSRAYVGEAALLVAAGAILPLAARRPAGSEADPNRA